MKTRVALLFPVLACLAAASTTMNAAIVEGARVDNMACDNFYFNVCQAVVTRPTLGISREGSDCVLSWTGSGFTLQGTSTLGSNLWTDLTSTSPARVPIGPGNQFFRLIGR